MGEEAEGRRKRARDGPQPPGAPGGRPEPHLRSGGPRRHLEKQYGQ